MAYLAWLFYMQWWHTSLLLFDWSIEARPNDKRSDRSNEFIWWVIKLKWLKKVYDASLQNFFTVFTFISRCGDRSTLMVGWMSLSDGLSSQTHWRRLVMHFYRTFLLFSHLYQSVATEWGSERTPRGRLISEQNPRGIHIHLWSPAHLRSENLGGTLC